MKVFLTGGTGFVGAEILRHLLKDGHVVRCLVRPGSEKKLPVEKNIEVRLGDATEPDSLKGMMDGCDAVIHMVGIIREFPGKGITFEKLHFEATRNIVEAAKTGNVKRYIQMSANGTRPDADSEYHQTKWRAEEAVRHSGLDWTIFRPSLIFGPDDDFINMIAGIIKKTPVMPVIGDGKYRMAPVAVEDVAASFVAALKHPETVGETYHVCGPDVFTYDELLDEIGKALGKGSVHKLHQPATLMKPIVSVMESFPQFPITSAQLTMLLEGNVCGDKENEKWLTTFGITPHPMPDKIRTYLKK